uniref:Major facilitator superfamily (MFS) profile domain-containing protein n=1 Tax=Romanomermis culicivorax TaxID=13658 RepID=A0A915JKP7_ROMCU
MPFLQWDAQTTMFQISVVYAVGNFFTLMGTFLVGHLMDTNGPRMAGLVSALLTFVFYLASSRAASFTGLLLVQPLRSAFCLNQVMESYLSSVTEENDRTRVILKLGVPLGIAAVAGPWMASKTVVAFDIRASVCLAGLVLIACTLPLIFFFLPESQHVPFSKRPRMLRFSDYQELLSLKSLRNTLIIRFLLDGPYMAYDNLSRQYVLGQFMSTYADLSYLFMLIGFTTIFTNLFLIRILQTRLQPQQLLQFALCLSALAYVAISFAQEFYLFLIFMPLQVIGMSIVYAELSAQTANCVERRNVGKAVGLGHAVNLSAATLFSLTAGVFISEFNFAAWCYIAAAVSLVVLVLLHYKGSYMNDQQANKLPSQMVHSMRG